MRLISCVGVANDLLMLPHFLRHYAGLGVPSAATHVILNAPTSGEPALEAAARILAEAGAPEPVRWIAPYTSDSMWEQRRALQQQVATPDDWVISADVDELHEYPAPLPRFLAACAARGIDCVQGPFIDRVAADGRLNAIAPAPSIIGQFPVQTDVIGAIRREGGMYDPFGTVKLMAVRGRVMPSRGGHHPASGQNVRYLFGRPLAEMRWIGRPAARFRSPLLVHHFKWVSTLLEGLRRRIATPGASKAGTEYGTLVLRTLGETGGFDMAKLPRRGPSPFDRLPWPWRVAALRGLDRAARTVA